MKDRLKKLLAIALVAVIAVPLTSAPALAGGYRHDDRGHYSNRVYHHSNRYSSNQVWTAVGVGLLGGALIGAATTRPAPVYYQEPPVVYVPPPVYVERPVYDERPVYPQPPPSLRYDPWCRCYR